MLFDANLGLQVEPDWLWAQIDQFSSKSAILKSIDFFKLIPLKIMDK